MESTHRWIEHTAELQLRLHAGSEAALFRQAVHALRELLEEDDEAPSDGPRVERTVEAEATDRAALLAEWLAELVFLAETEGLVPDDVRNLMVGEDSVTAVVVGRAGRPRHLVKAVTYHDLELHRDRDGWRGNVVLDV
jgi:SHS2 domain-containing protein